MNDWLDILEGDLVATIVPKITVEQQEYNIFPPNKDVFNAFLYTPWEDVKVVILGQDPYHTKGFAMGLAFGVTPSTPIPKSLINIYKELEDDLGIIRKNGCLIDWAEQGVLLLNTSLTVREGIPGSHSDIGWEQFTDNIIQTLSNEKEHLVFVLWGNHAIKKQKLIDNSKHYILTSPHPSPLSAHKGFFGSKPFSKTNAYLVEHKIPEITW